MEQIETLTDIRNAALNKRSLTCSKSVIFSKRPLPAAVVFNFTGCVILMLINKGLYIYEKKEKVQK